MSSSAANLLEFLKMVGKLKSIKRTGWVLRNVQDSETVAGHMYRMGMMALLLQSRHKLDKSRCVKLCLVHDLAECIVGDLTPFCGVDVEEKHRREREAMESLANLAGESGAELYDAYKEYESQATPEARFVKELDRLDMVLQAFEYEKLENKPGRLEEFFESTRHKFHHSFTLEIVQEVYKQRSEFFKIHGKKET